MAGEGEPVSFSESLSIVEELKGTNSAAPKKGTGGGVADYFAILGVGEKLVWKHAQKTTTTDSAATSSSISNSQDDAGVGIIMEEEDDAALLERFYREIVDVTLLVVTSSTAAEESHAVSSSDQLNTSSAASYSHGINYAQHLITVPSYNDNDSIAKSSASKPFYAVTIPPSPSDVTADTDLESRVAIDLNGMELIQQTRPAGRGESQGKIWTKSQVMDANLDPLHGLQGELRSLREEVELSSASSVSVSSVATTKTPLKDLRRKVQSTLRLNHLNRSVTADRRRRQARFYLAFRRRAPDEIDRPAVADVQIWYVKLHKSIMPSIAPGADNVTAATSTVVSASSSSYQANIKGAAALMGRVAEAGKQVVLERNAARRSAAHQLETSSFVDLGDIQHIPLHEAIPSPPAEYSSWSIPEQYKFLRVPTSRSSPARSTEVGLNDRGRFLTKTRLFAQEDDFSFAPPGSPSSVGVEAMVESSNTNVTDTSQENDRNIRELWDDICHPKVVQHVDEPAGRDAPFWSSSEPEFIYIPVLAIRRQRIGDEERYHEDPAIVELAVSFCDQYGKPILPEETYDDNDFDEPDTTAFSLVGKSGWCTSSFEEKSWLQQQSRPRDHLGAATILIKRNLPIGFADAAFATRVLDRFPYSNYKELPLPEEELPMFCYPTGCRLHRAEFSDAPLAQYYGFVVKNERGDSIYVSCVSFMEPLNRDKRKQLVRMSEKRRRVSIPHRNFCNRDGGEDESDFILTGFDEMTTFENKTICLVSRYPFWTAFRQFLSHLHMLSGSSSDLPLERYISHLLLSVPIPRPGGPCVLIPLPTLKVPLVLSLPPLKDLPLVDLPFERLVACLDIPTIVTIVLGFLALERKNVFDQVIIMSTRPSLVLDVCELLRSLLFPFDLCAPYVPRLTEPFMSCLDFPGAIFVGIHDDGSLDGLAATVRKNMPEDSNIVDLDSSSVDCSGQRMAVLNSSWGLIPATQRSILVSELETLCRDAGIAPGQEPLDSQIDSAFDAALPPMPVDDGALYGSDRDPLDDRAFRDTFLRFFCSLLGGYERYLVVPDVDFLISGNEWFDSKGFLATVSADKAAYLSPFVSTQLFQSFIQRRTEASDVHCLLFDECIAEFHSSPVPYGRLGGDVEAVTYPGKDRPQMLYSLLVDQAVSVPHAVTAADKSFDTDAGSDADSENRHAGSDAGSDFTKSELFSKATLDIALNDTGDWVTVPSRTGLPLGNRYIYCIDGNATFPNRLKPSLYFPSEPESWLVELTTVSNPQLIRSDKELEDADRRRKLATSYRGLHGQRRCLWQLPKLMGSHVLGSWLMCVPAQVGQASLTQDQQSKYFLRALGALRQTRSKQRIVPDEAAYRALMVACGRTKNDRRLELVRLFGLLRSDGIFPSAVTLGQYTRALAEGYSKRSVANPDEENGGVEVTEATSLKFATLFEKRDRGAEYLLNALDTNLCNLEDAGRKWRQRNLGSDMETSMAADEASAPFDLKTDRIKKKSHNKSWLPVMFASSIVPSHSSESNRRDVLSSESVTLLAIWSRTKSCDSCSYVPLEEEVQAGWDILGHNGDSPGGISCPRCGTMLSPMLGYKEMSIDDALESLEIPPQQSSTSSDADDFGALPPQIGPKLEAADSCYVTYVSPAALRKSLEYHIAEHGESILERDRLKAIDPELYYNFWWNCARFALPLPLPVARTESQASPKHVCAFVGWDHNIALRGCQSCAKSLAIFAGIPKYASEQPNDEEPIEAYEDSPLLARFNLQGYYASVWDHPDLSEILVTLVEACDKRDFKPVIECLLRCNNRRRANFGADAFELTRSSSSRSFGEGDAENDTVLAPSVELDYYRTVLYLAKYQCTSAFHAFFPATLKPCKGYHFWCPIVPLPIFDRLLRDAFKRVRMKESTVHVPFYEVSDVALGFRCVFGHLI